MARLWIFGILILLIGNEVMGQWYTDPQNPVAVYGEHVHVRGYTSDLEGGAYFFNEGPLLSATMSHVNIEGQWSCPLPGVVIGPPTSAYCNYTVLDPDNNLISHVTDVDPSWPDSPSLLNKWSPTGQQIWQTFSFPDTLTRPHYMVSDEIGGCIILISIEQEQTRWYIQRFDVSGQPQFGWTERPLLGPNDYYVAEMISDGVGGGFATWIMPGDSVYDMYLQHIRLDGSFAFADSGIMFVQSFYPLTSVRPSCAGSFILGWSRTQTEHHLTRFDSTGSIIWDRPAFDCDYVVSDRLGGLYFFQVIDSTYSRMNALGTMVFSGRHLTPWSYYTFHSTISSAGELIILHWDEDDEVWTLQKYDSLGTQVWAEPVPVLYGMPSGSPPYYEYMTADTRGGVILCFIRLSGTYFTRVDAFGTVGSSLCINQNQEFIPKSFKVTAYPNPFNSQINLTWTTRVGGAICFNITNLLGQQVLSVELPANTTRYIWDGRNAWGVPVSSGIYYATLKIRQVKQSMRIVLIK